MEWLESRCLLAGLDSEPAAVVGRHVYYNQSAFDGSNPAADRADDEAVAIDKQALLPGQAASWTNYTSFQRGINGLLIDVAGLLRPDQLDVSDFTFRIGNNSNPDTWQAAPEPTHLGVRSGEGDRQTDRVVITWSDGAVRDTWLQVTVHANSDTGLAYDDIFYFGNAVGESGNSAHDAVVDSADELGPREHPRPFYRPAAIDDPYDYNRDARVNATDEIIARQRAADPAALLVLLTAPLHIPAPTGLSVENDPNFGVQVSWRAVPSASEYEIWRSTRPLLNTAQRIAAIDSAEFIDHSPVFGEFGDTNFYWVRAKVQEVPGPFGEVGGTYVARTATPTTAAAYVNRTTGTISILVQNVLEWYLESPFAQFTGEDIPDQLPGNGTVTDTDERIGELASTRFSYFVDFGQVAMANLPPTSSYFLLWYRVNADIGRPRSGPVWYLETLDLAVSGFGASQDNVNGVTLNWRTTTGALSYEIWRSATNDFSEAQILVQNITGRSFFDTNVLPGQTNSYWIRATGIDGPGLLIGPVQGSALAPPDIPQSLQASDGSDDRGIALVWESASRTQVYDVWRSVQNDPASAVRVATVADTSWIDDRRNLIDRQTWYYWVSARNAAGSSDLSLPDAGMFSENLFPSLYTATAIYDALTGNITVSANGVARWYVESSSQGLTGTPATTLPASGGQVTDNDTRVGEENAFGIVYNNHMLGPVAAPHLSRDDLRIFWDAGQGAGIESLPLIYFGWHLHASDALFEDRVQLQWPPSILAETYQLWRREVGSENERLLADQLAVTDFQDVSAEPGVEYEFRVRGRSPGGNLFFSEWDRGQRRAIEAPLNVVAEDVGRSDFVPVTWSPVAGAVSYEVWKGTSDDISAAQMLAEHVPTPAYRDYNVQSNVTYYYWVRARGESVIGPFSLPDSGNLLPIGALTGLRASDGDSASYIELRWNRVIRTRWYEIWRGTEPDLASARLIADSVSATNYRDSSAVAGHRYYYWVRAIGRYGMGSFSDAELGFIRRVSDQVRAEYHVATGEIMVTATNVVEWQIESASQGFTGISTTALPAGGGQKIESRGTIGETAASDFSYVNLQLGPVAALDLLPGDLRVLLVDEPGELPAIGIVTHVGINSPSSVQASDALYLDKIVLSWFGVTGALSYDILRSETSDPASAQVIEQNVEALSYEDRTASPGVEHYYWLRAIAADGLKSPLSQPDIGSLAALPARPTDLQASDGLSAVAIDVTWAPAARARRYFVYRNTVDSFETSQYLGSAGGPAWQDRNGPIIGQRYYYWVVAENAFGNSDASLADTGFTEFVAPADSGTAAATYDIATGEIVVSVQGVNSWYIESSSHQLIGIAPLGLPAGGGDLLDTDQQIGESATGLLTYQNVYLGPVAATNAQFSSLYIYWHVGGQAFSAPVTYTENYVTIQATDWQYDIVQLQWSPVARAQSFEIWRGLSADPQTATLLASEVTGTIYNDDSSLANVSYYYWVRAKTAGGVSPFGPGDYGIAIELVSPATVFASDGESTRYVRVSWSSVAGAQTYQVWRGDSSDPATATLLAAGLVGTDYFDETANETPLYYWVRAQGFVRTSPFGAVNAGRLRPLRAPHVTTSQGQFSDRIAIGWSAIDGAVTYEVWRGVDTTFSSAERVAAGLTTLSYEDFSIQPDQRYYYWIRGISARATGPLSEAVLGYVRVVSEQARAEYHVLSGEIVVTVEGVINWYLESASASFTGAPAQGLPARGGQKTDTDRRIGETSLANFSYADLHLGPVAVPDLLPDDLQLRFNDRLEAPSAYGIITFVGLNSPRSVQASDQQFPEKVTLGWLPVVGADLYQVFRGVTEDVGLAQQIADGVMDAVYDDTSAASGVTYFYWVRAVNETGSSLFSQVETGSLLPPPTAPTRLNATDGHSDQFIELSWDSVSLATSYEVWRSTSEDPATAQRIASDVVDIFWIDSDANLAARQWYYYWVTAVNAAGTSTWSAAEIGYRDATLTASPGTAQAVYHVESGELIVSANNVVAWYIASSSRSLTGTEPIGIPLFGFLINSDDQIGESGYGELAYQHVRLGPVAAAGLPEGDLQIYWTMQSGQPEQSAPVAYVGMLPVVTASDQVFADKIDVHWTPVDGALSYDVYRGLSADFETMERIAERVSTTTLQDTIAVAGNQYYYRVRAVGSETPGPFSSADSGEVAVPPAAPTAVRATDGTFEDGVEVSWDAVPFATAYDVWRSDSDDLSRAVVIAADVPLALWHDTDRLLQLQERYYYWVVAKNAAGTGPFGASDPGFRDMPIVAPVFTAVAVYDAETGNISVAATEVFSWHINSRSGGLTGSAPLGLPIFTGDAVTDTDTTIGEILYNGSSFSTVRLGPVAEIDLLEGDLTIDWQTFGGFVVRGQPVTYVRQRMAISASDGTFENSVRVDWPSVEDALSYQVWRNDVNDVSSASLLAEGIAGLQYQDATAVEGTMYYYWVRAVTPRGTGRFSRSDLGHILRIEPPASVTASDGTYEDFVLLHWTPATGAQSYQVWRSESADAEQAILIADRFNGLTYEDRSAQFATTHFYWVRTVGESHISPFGTPTAGRLKQLPSPRQLTASDGSHEDRISIEWSAVPQANGYELFRGIDTNLDSAERIAETTETSFGDRSPRAGQRYYYWARAIGRRGPGLFSTPDVGYLASTSDQVRVTYYVSTGEIVVTANRVVNWYLESDFDNFTGDPVTALPAGGGLKTDTHRRIGETSLVDFSYENLSLGRAAVPNLAPEDLRLLFNDELSLPPQQGVITFVGVYSPQTVLATDRQFADRVSVSWSSVDQALSYDVFRSRASDVGSAQVIAENIVGTSYDDMSAEPGVTFYYWIRARGIDGPGRLGGPDVGIVAAPPAAPALVQASDGEFENRIQVTWAAVPFATQYDVWRSATDVLADAQRVATDIVETSWSDDSTDLVLRQPRFYWVAAKNIAGISPLQGPDRGFTDNAVIAPVDTAIAVYHVLSGRIVVSVNSVVNWYIQSASMGLTGTNPVGLPGGGGIVTNSDRRIGESHVREFTYQNLNLGPVAQPNLSVGDLQIFWNAGLGQPVVSQPVIYEGSPFRVDASDQQFTDRITLSWSAINDAQSYELYRGLSPEFDSMERLASDLSETNYVDAAVTAGIRYYYRVQAIMRNEPSLVTPADEGSAVPRPIPPGIVQASDGRSDVGIEVFWSEVPWATHYDLFRHVTNDLSAAVAVATDWTGLSYFDAGSELVPRQRYYYWIRAKNLAGISDFGQADIGYFDQPLIASTSASARATYDVDTGTMRVAVNFVNSWYIESASGQLTATPPQGLPTENGTLLDTDHRIGESKSTGFYYDNRYLGSVAVPNLPEGDLRIHWESGNHLQSAPVIYIGIHRALVEATWAQFTDKVSLQWSSIPGARSYEVYRGLTEDVASMERIAADVTATILDDHSAAPGVSYFYRVRAVLEEGTGPFSHSVVGLAGGVPTPPLEVSASDGTSEQAIDVTWLAALGATQYDVWRHTVNDSAGAQRIAADVTALSWRDSDAQLVIGRTYYYWVLAKNPVGISQFENSDSGHLGTEPTIPADTAAAVYIVSTGEIIVSANHVVNWYVESRSRSLTGSTPIGLPAGNGLITDSDRRIGETSFNDFTYFELNLGAVAATNLPEGDLILFWNGDRGQLAQQVPVRYVASRSELPAAASDEVFANWKESELSMKGVRSS